MKNKFALLAATAALSLAASANAADEVAKEKSSVDYKDNGGYTASHSTQETNTKGTTTSSNTNVDVDVDSNGLITKTVKNSAVKDPKGMMNKKVDDDKTIYEERENGGYKQTTIRSHKDAAGNDIYYKTVTDVTIDDKGNITTVAKTEKTVDPKGWFSWFNQKKSSEMTKTVNGVVVEDKKSD